jgi:hypothetical protein
MAAFLAVALPEHLSQRCCQTIANHSVLGQYNCPLFSKKTAPFGKSGGVAQLKDVSTGK